MSVFRAASQRKSLLVALAITGLAVAPARAQRSASQAEGSQQYETPTTDDGLRTVAAALNEERGAAFRRKSPAEVAQLFTRDAVFVELLPRLQVMRGRPEIQAHFQELLAAQSTNLTYTVSSAELTGNGGMTVGGDYVLTAGGNKQIQGHFFQLLRHEDGGWKIAMNVFARPEPVTVGEKDDYRGN